MTDSEHRRIMTPAPNSLQGLMELALEVPAVASVHIKEERGYRGVLILSFTENRGFKEGMPTPEKIKEVQEYIDERRPVAITVGVVGVDSIAPLG